MSVLELTAFQTSTRIADALHRQWGDQRSALKVVAGKVGAGVHTAKKWFAAENAPSAEYLIKLMAESDEVFSEVLQLCGRSQIARGTLAEERIKEALAILEGKAKP